MKKEMMDNRKVSDNHQQGIERVKMRKGELDTNKDGCMSGGWKHGKGSEKDGHFKRSGKSLTPRRA